MIVITGASDGLGREIARLYKESGSDVVNISRGSCEYADTNIKADLATNEGISGAADQILAIDGELDAFINCVGVWGEEKIEDITEGELDTLLATNVKAPLLLTSKLIARIKKDGADVVNVISTAGLKGNKDHIAYAASKWGERGFTEALRNELSSYPSRVISVYPGGMKTKFFAKSIDEDVTEDGSYWMDPADVAKHIVAILDLPKGIEVSEVTLNRKKVKS